MRADNAKAHCVSVNIRDNNFNNKSHQKQFDRATDITFDIYDSVKELFDEVWNGKTPLRLLGVTLSDVSKGDSEQLTFFSDDNSQSDKRRKLDTAMDAIRNRFGDSTILLGSTMNTKRPKKK